MTATAAGSITFTSPASSASYSGAQAYTISGTITPTPTQADNVGITVKNPSGSIVDAGNVAVTSGAFSYSTAAGSSVNPSSWPTGTYTITATDSFGATGSITFTYTAAGGSGQTVFEKDVLGNLSLIEQQIHNLSNDLNGNVTALNSAETSESNAITSLTNTVGSMSSTLGNLQSSLSSLTSTVGTINTNVNNLSSLGAQLSSASSSLSNTQTYVLVVAVLAAITVVLELAILVRKLS